MADHDNDYRLLPSHAEVLAEFLWGQEAKTMGLAEKVMEWTREWKEEGLQEGLQKGREEGLENLREVVLYLLEQRFGIAVSEEARHRVLAIRDLDELKRMAKGIVPARSLRDLGLD